MTSNPVGWFEIYVQDMPRAKAFYEGVFQLSLSPLPTDPALEMWSFPGPSPENYRSTPGATGALVRMPGCPSGGGGTLVYFSCADCGIEAARAAALGGQIARPKFAIGEYGHIALVVDTEGNMIGLHSWQ
ncbi:MAG: hypothetical protein RIR00_2029 [Pseudomonadota bacterium]|jgi:predicted enzyme related to lactoylglutathione lyase